MGTLWIALDLFCPEPYRTAGGAPESDEYGPPPQPLWSVVQPLLTRGEADSIPLDAYFKLDAATFKQNNHVIKFIDKGDASIRPPRPAVAPSGSAALIPVPLPPGTELLLNVKGMQSRRVLRAQRLTAADPDDSLLLPIPDWPSFAMSTFSPPPITSYGQINDLASEARDLAKREILSWAVGLVPAVLQGVAELPSKPLTAKEAFAYAQLIDLEKEIAKRQAEGKAPPDEAYVRTYLKAVQGGKERVAALWDRMLEPSPANDPRPILAPRFRHDLTSLASNPRDYLGLADPAAPTPKPKPIAVSTLGKLWWDIGAMPGIDEKEKALGRLFGFGERRRWPKAQIDADPGAFMILEEQTPQKAKLLPWTAKATNVFSLLGLAFRLPFKAGEDPNGASLDLSVMGTKSPDYKVPLAELAAAIKQAGGGFSTQVGIDPDRPNGFFYFAPKMAEGVEVTGPTPVAFVAPPVLLDIVSPDARWTTALRPVTPRPRLSYEGPQRLALAPAELYRIEDLTGKLADHRLSLKVRVTRQDFSTASAFRVALEAEPHPDERYEITQRFARAFGGQEAGTQLWGAKAGGGVGTWPLDAHILKAGTDDHQRPYLIVEDDGRNGLQALLDALANPGDPVEAETREGWRLDLIFPALKTPVPNLSGLFNLVTAGFTPDQPPLFVLKRRFTSRVSLCADRMIDRIEVTLKPARAKPVGVLEEHLWNFNKLRLRLTSLHAQIVARHEDAWDSGVKAAGTAIVRRLLDPDAAVPMPTDHYTAGLAPWLAGPPPDAKRTFGYFVAAVFTQDHTADESLTQLEQNESESLRYQNFLTPQVPWTLEGHVEHQYSYRIGLAQMPIALRLASDISHPAEAAVRGEKGATAGIPLIRWDIESGTAIQLRFPRAFIAEALKGTKPGSGTADNVKRPPRLRAIYEPLADLVASVDPGGEARLRIERWVFDADGQLDPGEIRTSAIPQNMRLAGWHELVLRPDTAGLQNLAAVRALLEKPLTQFEAALEAEAAKTGEDWLTLPIKFDSSWTAGGDPLVGTLAQSSDVLRLGLDLTRNDLSVVDETMVADPATAPGFGLPIDDRQIDRYPLLKGETFASLRADAAEELKQYLAKPDPSKRPSRLRRSFAWFQARSERPVTALAPVSARVGDPNSIQDPRRPDIIFGPLSPFLLVPIPERPPVANVVDFYFVPLAFRPLAIHKDIGDAATTLEFAMFVTQLLDDLINGRAMPGGIDLTATNAADALRLSEALADQLAPDTAKRMADLVTCVHNPADPAPTPLFTSVMGLVADAFTDLGARRTLQELFVASPSLFASSKGFGLILFGKTTWTDRLHSLQLVKEIRPPDPAKIGQPLDDQLRIDRDIFPFSALREMNGVRYLIDILDDERYDNEFQIAPSEFLPKRVGALPVPRETQKQRGGAQARSGEDVIEGRSTFGANPALRQIETDAVAWNHRWKYAQIEDLYLLPSRRVPAAPVKVKALACGPTGGKRDAHPRRSDMEVSFLGGPVPKLAEQFQDNLERNLERKAEVVLSVGSSASDDALIAIRHGAPRKRDWTTLASGKEVRDWWRLDSFTSEHYFVFESDEEGSSGDIPFSNDRFSIDVEVYEDRAPDEAEVLPSNSKVPDILGQWFEYQRKLRNGQSDNPPSPTTFQQIDTELRKWLGPVDNILTPRDVAMRALAANWIRKTTTYFALAPGSLTTQDVPLTSGSVLAAEIMELKERDGRFVLRIVVLDECWTASRVRVRLERNYKDVDNDGVADINPAFQMFSAYSAWSSPGRERYARDFSTMVLGTLPPRVSAMEPTAIDARGFVDALEHAPNQPVSYGTLLKPILEQTFLSDDKASHSFWNAGRSQAANLIVGGMIVQHRPDLHPRFGNTAIVTVEPSREEDIPRMHLPQVGADGTGPLLAALIPADVRSLHHDAVVTWTSRTGDTLLECRWPIRFMA